MPIIATVGRRSFKGRFLIFFIYFALMVGAITTVYPFWLMVAGSVASNHTAMEFRLVPRYLYSERGLFEAQLFNKYYRYSGIADIEWQWKVDVPGSYGKENVWTQVPGQRPGPDEPVARTLQIHFCVDPFEDFKTRYSAIGSPDHWNDSFREVVHAHYPFAVNAVQKLVERSAYRLERHDFIKTVEGAFLIHLGRFAADYDDAGRPIPGSNAYRSVLAEFPLFEHSQHFAATMRSYVLCRKPELSDRRVRQRIADYNEFRQALPLALRDAYWIGSRSRLFEGDEMYQSWVRDKYGSVASMNTAYKTIARAWVQVYAPYDWLNRRSLYVENNALNRDWFEWKAELPAKYVRPAAGEFWWCKFLEKRYDGQVAKLNRAYGTHHLRFFDAGLPERIPENPAAGADWELYVRTLLAPRFMRFEDGHELWRGFLIEQFGSLESINTKLNRSWESVDQIHLPDMQSQPIGVVPTKRENDLLLMFVAEQLPIEYLRVRTAENIYRQSLLDKYGTLEAINEAHGLRASAITDIYFPMPEVDWLEATKHGADVKLFTFTRAYKTAINHIVRHKRSLWNTFVFCASVVLAALLVNPLCAYALSRFNLPGAYKILLFLLATMAFPAEVTMIPNFLLLKSFPLLRIVCCAVGLGVGGMLATRLISSKRAVYVFAGAAIGGLLGVSIVTFITASLLDLQGDVSLLNTYWALILPGVASGYSVFILKGFFDSLPQELYESAVIDGAGELRIFGQITLPMSKPVLAVIALWSFTTAYGSFTWALIICQDEQMWTLMVHLYQYQMVVDPSERLSALVLASLPTLVVFLIAQKIILKGIILPTYK